MKPNNNRKDIYLYGTASLLNDLSSDLASSALPFFILNLGGNAGHVTLLMGLKEALPEITKPLAGYVSDRVGVKKPFVILGYVLSSLFRILLALSTTLRDAFIAIMGDRLGKGIRDTPRDVLISFLDGKKGYLYGIHKSMDTLGALLGSVLGVWLATFLLPREVLGVAAAIGLFSFIPLIWVKERKSKKIKPSWVFDSRVLPLVLLGFVITNVGFPISVLSKSFEESVLYYLVFNVTYLVSSPVFGRIADERGFRRVFAYGFFVAALAYVFLLNGIALAVMVAMGLVFALMGGAGRSFLAYLSKESGEPGTEMGLLSAAVGVGSLAGSALAAALLSHGISLAASAFTFLSLISIASLKKI